MPYTRKANSIDRHIAGKIRERRRAISMSQIALGDAIGVTFQQIQKVEKAKNRISAGNLWKAAQALGKPVQYFYEGLS